MSNIIPSSPGIYKITCTANKKIYIGSAVNLQQRKRQHFSSLRQNKHDNPKLQRAWNKYTEQAFAFEVWELVLIPEMLTAREQYYLDTLKPFGHKGFNIARIAGSQLGYKPTPEAIEKVRQANIGRKMPPEHKEKLRQVNTGREVTPDTRKKISQANTGKKRTSEMIAKLKGRKPSPQTLEAARQANLGKPGYERTPEIREKQRQAKLGKKPSPQTLEAARQAHIGLKPSPETVEKRRQTRLANGGFKHTPESIAKMKAHKKTPEHIGKVGRANRGKIIFPETREKMRQAKIGKKPHNLGKKRVNGKYIDQEGEQSL